ncbi:MAG: ATP-dependent helicase HrpB [Bacteroidetes bacterium]|nr:ATP-dependent helicase HrpB [Bacteroidota bacterium]
MPFDYKNTQLPVAEIIPDVQQKLKDHTTVIIGAPPGAGKSTLLPLCLFEESFLAGKKIIMLEPRRLAARSIAMRMAELLGEEVGQTVGYRIRFENRVSAQTKIEVVTEGILTRMLQSDNALEQVGLVIFDEFHERNLQADLALALCREAQQVLRPDLRIMIMSATLNIPQLQSLLNAPVIESKGRQYPVDVIYTNDADEFLLPELVAQTIARSLKEHQGDVLAFLPGEGEIRKCEEILKNQFMNSDTERSRSINIHPLYGMLPHNEQYAAIMPNKQGKRKIVLATSIAETSLTIEGISIVVDSGFGRRSRFDPASGLSRLETLRISKDAADQRAGRAGRLSAGVCYRLWTKATHVRMAEHRIPEIMEADLCSLVLELSKWGSDDINNMCWLTLPPKNNLQQAYDTLQQIGALEQTKITEHGKQVHQLACHPRIAHMLLLAETRAMKNLGCDIAGILEERDPLPKDSGIDLNLRIEALRRARSNNAFTNKFKRIEKNAASYRKLLNLEIDNSIIDAYETGLLLAYAYPERIASAKPGNNAQFQLANGKIAAAGHKDDLAHEAWLAVANMDLRDGLGKIFMAAPLNPKDLIHLVKEKQNISWDTRKGGLIASTELKIGSIVLKSSPIKNPDSELVIEAICNAIKTEGESLLDFTDHFTQLQNRIGSLAAWHPDEQWPQSNTTYLLQNAKEWLGPYVKDIRKVEELKRLDVYEALLHSLTWEQQQLLEQLAPAKLEVPSGSKIRIEYFANGSQPIIAVRLQEVFGMTDTPTVNKGTIKTVLHLLSPGYKPVQVTTDLKSFWNNTYHEVKKELQRRYPKHAWPDDPWSAAAVAKGRSTKF